MKETNPDRLALLLERFKDVCLVEREVWTEIFLPKEAGQGAILTSVQDRYQVVIDDQAIEDTLEANIPLGGKALAAAIQQYKGHISFIKKI